MSDKEIDEILNEIKQHSLMEKGIQAAEDEEKIEEASETFSTDDIIKLVDEEESAEEKEQDSTAEEPVFSLQKDESDIPVSDDSEDESSLSFAPSDESEEKDETSKTPETDEATETPEALETNEVTETHGAPKAPDAESDESANDFWNLSDISTEDFEEEDYTDGKKSKKPLIITIAIILIIALAAGIYFGFFYKKDTTQTTTVTETTQAEEPDFPTKNNPLTGESEYNTAAIGKRPVAVVVENEYGTEAVKPQWGINEADIVLEGESEYSTRLLLFWADYTDMPAQIGPARSARPPFIYFSELFNSIFIHAGFSRTKGDYIGANTVFENEKIDHINLLTLGEDGTYFGRDTSRTETIEHTGYFNGESTAELIEKQNFKTDIDLTKFTLFEFNEAPQALSDKAATTAKFVWSDINTDGHCQKVGSYYYDESLEKYSTTDFDSDFGKANLEFENLIFLLDTTEYITKEKYKDGKSEIYCDYKLSGGKGAVLSQGTAIDITWGVKDGKLWMKDEDGNSVKLNPGKSYIGYGSSNNGGSITIE